MLKKLDKLLTLIENLSYDLALDDKPKLRELVTDITNEKDNLDKI